MKIKLSWQASGLSTQTAEGYMQVVFAHIADKIRITNVSGSSVAESGAAPAATVDMSSLMPGIGAGQRTIIVDYELQPSVAEDVATLIRNAVWLKGDLTLVSVESPPKRILVDAIKLEKSDDQSTTYHVDHNFAQFVADNDQYRRKIMRQRVLEVKLTCEEFSPGRFRFIGQFATIEDSSSAAPASPVTTNAYNKLAQILEVKPGIRDDILDERFRELKLTINADGASSTEINKAPVDAQVQTAAMSARLS